MYKFKVGDIVVINKDYKNKDWTLLDSMIFKGERRIEDIIGDRIIVRAHGGDCLPHIYSKNMLKLAKSDRVKAVSEFVKAPTLIFEKDEEAMTYFSTGAVRDTDTDKAKLDLLPWDMVFRLAKWYELGAKKYGRNNWRLGQKKSHTFASLMRHAIKYQLGQTDEDHLSAVIWNAFSLMNVDEYYKDNEDLNDL